MILASHVIFGTYGFWLPNDPRGSWSDFVGSYELFRTGGPATKTETRQSVARVAHDSAARLRVKKFLQYPPVRLDERQRSVVADGFSEYAKRAGIAIFACAIMTEHVHLVLARHRLTVEQIVTQLKGSATSSLEQAGIHPLQHHARKNGRLPKCWARGEWKVFLSSPDHLARAVGYVLANPVKEHLPSQNWSFVDDWRSALSM